MRRVRPLLALSLLPLLVACDSGPPSPPVERVILIGVDGLDWKVLQPLLERGVVPSFARLVEEGASGELETLLPTISPIVWASIATGKKMDKHGIVAFGLENRRGTVTPFTSNSRRARALWNILTSHDRESLVVGWWTTWPAESIAGSIVSNRALYSRFNLWFDQPGFGETLPNLTHPPQLIEDIASLLPAPDGFEGDFAARFLPGEPPLTLEPKLHDPVYELFLAHRRDDAFSRIHSALSKRRPNAAFSALYLNGVDIASHYYWKYRFPEDWDEAIPPDELERYGRVIDRSVVWVDRAIAPLVAQASEKCAVMVVSDHGFEAGQRSDTPSVSGIHLELAPPGVILASGGRIEAGKRIRGASVYDIAPTLLHWLGLPVGEDMDGEVLRSLTRAPGHSRRSIEWVDSYEPSTPAPPARTAPIATDHDELLIERLEALGYLDREEGTVRAPR